MNIDSFLDDLSALRFPYAFNPYSEKCAVHDIDDAPKKFGEKTSRQYCKPRLRMELIHDGSAGILDTVAGGGRGFR